MSPKLLNMPVLAEILENRGWADIGELYTACREQNVFGDDFYNSAIEKAMKAEIRRILRSGKVQNARGETIMVASIKIKEDDGKGGVRLRRVYKQEMLLDIGDCVEVINYWRSNKDICEAKLRYYVRLAVRLHGDQVQGLLPFVD